MSWTWRYENEQATPVVAANAPRPEQFPTQSDAESWLGENWRELRAAGVHQVRLYENGREVYGPMSLQDP